MPAGNNYWEVLPHLPEENIRLWEEHLTPCDPLVSSRLLQAWVGQDSGDPQYDMDDWKPSPSSSPLGSEKAELVSYLEV